VYQGLGQSSELNLTLPVGSCTKRSGMETTLEEYSPTYVEVAESRSPTVVNAGRA
jgi:hypothetical protein